jgi:hypothetical protein
VTRETTRVRRHCGDPLFSLLLDRWGLGEPGLALLTALAGFGVLAAWYGALVLADPGTLGLRGLFDYSSATLGDLVLLPFLAATAVRYAALVDGSRGHAPAAGRRERRLLGLLRRACRRREGLAFVFAVTTAAVGLQVLDELYGPDRNWTVPTRGAPRLVAFYHQLFFASQAYLAAFLVYRHAVTSRFLRRLRGDAARFPRLAALAEETQGLFAWALLGWSGFVLLRILDFMSLLPTPSVDALVHLPAPVVALAVYYAVLLAFGLGPLSAWRSPLLRPASRRQAAILTAIAFLLPWLGAIAFAAPGRVLR